MINVQDLVEAPIKQELYVMFNSLRQLEIEDPQEIQCSHVPLSSEMFTVGFLKPKSFEELIKVMRNSRFFGIITQDDTGKVWNPLFDWILYPNKVEHMGTSVLQNGCHVYLLATDTPKITSNDTIEKVILSNLKIRWTVIEKENNEEKDEFEDDLRFFLHEYHSYVLYNTDLELDDFQLPRYIVGSLIEIEGAMYPWYALIDIENNASTLTGFLHPNISSSGTICFGSNDPESTEELLDIMRYANIHSAYQTKVMPEAPSILVRAITKAALT